MDSGGGGMRRMSRQLPVKRRRDGNFDAPKISLERVLGLTASHNGMLAVDPMNNVIAYPAGCVIVLHQKNKQVQIFNHSKKTITALAFSADGKYLVTGECGHQPSVRVFSVEERTQVAEFQHGHKFGIACVAFSSNHKYIISIGTQHDMMVNVWSWRAENKAASNKVSCKVNAINFSEGGSMFVTVGNRHVKFWYMDASQSEIRNETVPLLGRSGILADQKNNNFVDVLCGRGDCAGSTFVITQSGLLCEFSIKRLLVRHVELRTTRAYALTGGGDALFVGCADGIIRAFNPRTLQFIVTLPKPHPLGIDIMTGSSGTSLNSEARYPDVVAVRYNQEKRELVSINNDHSLYVWDVRDLRRVGKVASFLYHSSCIWGVEVYPPCESEMLGMLPPGSFLTCSSDDTIRIWNLDPHWHAVSDTTPKRNIYSTELLKMIYTDPSLTCLCEQDMNQANPSDKTDTASDTRTGVRCISVSPDGTHLASGDRSGNLRLHDLQFMDEMTVIEAHDSEILCLEFSNYDSGRKLLCSASRDRLIHVFDVSEGYSLLQTLDDHSASVMSVKLTWSAADQTLWMLSCGADKSILFRSADCSGEVPLQFMLRHHLVSKSTLHDMIVDPTQRFTVTACQDRNIRIYNMETGKLKKAFKASAGDDGTLLKVTHDRSGAYLAASCSDKTTALLDFLSGEVISVMYGHSESVTGVRFSNDMKHIITVSADGCIFIWRVHPELTHRMQARLKHPVHAAKAAEPDSVLPALIPPATHGPDLVDAVHPAGSAEQHAVTSSRHPTVAPDHKTEETTAVRRTRPGLLSTVVGLTPVREDVDAEVEEEEEEEEEGASDGSGTPSTDYRFSLGQLPQWAKKQLTDVNGENAGDDAHDGAADDGPDAATAAHNHETWQPTAPDEGGTLSALPAHIIGSKYVQSPPEEENKADDFHEILKSEIIYYPTEEANRENDGDFKVVEASKRDAEPDSASDNASAHAYDEDEDDDEAAMQQHQQLQQLSSPGHAALAAQAVPFDRALYDFEQDEHEFATSPSATTGSLSYDRQQPWQQQNRAAGISSDKFFASDRMDAEPLAAPLPAVSRAIAADGRHIRSDATAYGEDLVKRQLSLDNVNNTRAAVAARDIALKQSFAAGGAPPSAPFGRTSAAGGKRSSWNSAVAARPGHASLEKGDRVRWKSTPHLSATAKEQRPNAGERRSQPATDVHGRRSTPIAGAGAGGGSTSGAGGGPDTSRLKQPQRSRSRESLLASGADSLHSLPSLSEDDRTETLKQRSQSSRDLTSWRKGNDSSATPAAQRPTDLPLKSSSAAWTTASASGFAEDRQLRRSAVAPGSSAAGLERLSSAGGRRHNTTAADDVRTKDASTWGSGGRTASARATVANGRGAAVGDGGRVATPIVTTVPDGFGSSTQRVEGAVAALKSAVALVKQSRDQLLSGLGNGGQDDLLATLDEAARSAADQLNAIAPRTSTGADVVMGPLLEHYSERLLVIFRAKLELELADETSETGQSVRSVGMTTT